MLDAVDRFTTVRMPWHDIGCVVFKKAASDVARHFIQRWNHAKKIKDSTKANDRYPLLLPRSTKTGYKRLPTFIRDVCKLVNCQVLSTSLLYMFALKASPSPLLLPPLSLSQHLHLPYSPLLTPLPRCLPLSSPQCLLLSASAYPSVLSLYLPLPFLSPPPSASPFSLSPAGLFIFLFISICYCYSAYMSVCLSVGGEEQFELVGWYAERRAFHLQRLHEPDREC